MSKVLTALLASACFAAGIALSASTANAQSDTWNGGWHVGGDYYYPTYSYAAAPIYDYGSVPAYGTAGYSYGSAPIYNYVPVPAYSPAGYGYASAPLYDYGSAPAYGVAGYSYGAAPLYAYGSVPTYSTVVVGAPMQTVRTVEIVRTVYPSARSVASRERATRQAAVRSTAGSLHLRPQRNYTASTSNVAAPGSASYNYAANARPLYDTAATSAAQPVAAPVNGGPVYRYVYERDRILVIDPSTNAIVQTLQR